MINIKHLVRSILSIALVISIQSSSLANANDFSKPEQSRIEKLALKYEEEIQESARMYRNKIIKSLRVKIIRLKSIKEKKMLSQIIRLLEEKNKATKIDGVLKNTITKASAVTATEPKITEIINENSLQTDSNFYFVVSIFLDGKNSNTTMIEEMETMRSQLAKIDPDLKVSWSMTNDFIFHESNRPALAKVINMVDVYGDEIGFGFGFPNNQHTLASFQSQVAEWLYMYRYNAFNQIHVQWTMNDFVSVFNSIPEKYRPTSMTTYAINPEQASWIQENFWIDAFMGWTATQYQVDQLSWEWSPLMPYWSDKSNPLVPAQNNETNSRMIFMNTITVDPIGSTVIEGESRWTIHPADPLTWGKSQLHTVNQYLNNPYKDKNNINYLSLFVDINWILRDPSIKANWENMIQFWPKNVPLKVIGVKEFAERFKKTTGKDNDHARFNLSFRWSWETKWSYSSPSDIQYLWMEDKTERIVLKKRDGEMGWKVADFTDYSKTPVPILKYTTKGNEEDLSYVTWRNFKLFPNAALTEKEKARIKLRVQSIGFWEVILYED